MKFLIADAAPLIRCGLRSIVRDRYEKTSFIEADNVDDVLECDDQDLGLIWLDMSLPGLDGLSGLGVIRSKYPDTPIAVPASSLGDRGGALRAIELGIQGIILERAPIGDILESLNRIKDGEIVVPKEVLAKTGSWQHRASRDVASREKVARCIATLTRRQQEALTLLGEGKTNAQIASALGITEHTARLHVSAVLIKLEVSNRTQAALLKQSTL